MTNRKMIFRTENPKDDPNWVEGVIPDFLRSHLIRGFDSDFAPRQFGYTLAQRCHVWPFYIQHHLVNVEESDTVMPVTKGALAIEYTLCGNVEARLYDEYRIPLHAGTYGAYDLKGDMHRADFPVWSYLYEFFHIDIEPVNLAALLVANQKLAPLAERLIRRSGNVLNVEPLTISPAAYLCINAILDNIYTGKVAEYYLYPICLSLYTQYATQVSITEDAHLWNLNVDGHFDATDVKDMLREIRIGAEIGIDTKYVAQRYNTSRSTINSLFLQNYFITADDLVTAVRMNSAFHQIRKTPPGAQLNLARLSRRCGYRNRSRFVSDFEQYFRILPEDLARLPA